HAAPGEILVSPQIGRLIAGRCALQACAVSWGDGKSTQMDVYRVLGLAERGSPLVGLGGHPPRRFVRRERGLVTLHSLVGRVQGGRGQVVGVVGEPGMGKSRLLEEFRRSLLGQPVIYLEGRCLSYSTAIPYGPVLELLRANCGISETEGPEALTEKIR